MRKRPKFHTYARPVGEYDRSGLVRHLTIAGGLSPQDQQSASPCTGRIAILLIEGTPKAISDHEIANAIKGMRQVGMKMRVTQIRVAVSNGNRLSAEELRILSRVIEIEIKRKTGKIDGDLDHAINTARAVSASWNGRRGNRKYILPTELVDGAKKRITSILEERTIPNAHVIANKAVERIIKRVFMMQSDGKPRSYKTFLNESGRAEADAFIGFCKESLSQYVTQVENRLRSIKDGDVRAATEAFFMHPTVDRGWVTPRPPQIRG